jgi:hypothetical protein
MSLDATQLAKAKFLEIWQRLYPETPPISHVFKERLRTRWARIHNLPDAKRYPKTNAEWGIVVDRQNRVIDSLMQQGTTIRFVINFIAIDCYLFKAFDLENVGVFVDEEGETVFQSFTFETTWERNTLNPVLILIADGDLRAFIMGPDCLIAPYDGGIDVILKDPHTCWAFKRQFKDWLSKRADGL